MTSLIYRGFSHDGVCQLRPVTSQNLTYRGVRHSSHAEPVLKPTHAPEKIYRGVRYAPRMAGTLESAAPLFGGPIAPVSSRVIG